MRVLAAFCAVVLCLGQAAWADNSAVLYFCGEHSADGTAFVGRVDVSGRDFFERAGDPIPSAAVTIAGASWQDAAGNKWRSDATLAITVLVSSGNPPAMPRNTFESPYEQATFRRHPDTGTITAEGVGAPVFWTLAGQDGISGLTGWDAWNFGPPYPSVPTMLWYTRGDSVWSVAARSDAPSLVITVPGVALRDISVVVPEPKTLALLVVAGLALVFRKLHRMNG